MGEGEANTQNVSLSLSLSFVRDRVIAVAFNRAAAKLGLLFFHRRITDSWRKLVFGKVDVGQRWSMIADCFWEAGSTTAKINQG